MSETIQGTKLIEHNAAGVNNPDDPSYPWLLVATLRPPSLMSFSFICIHGGSEQIRVRGMTKEALEAFVKLNKLDTHCRLRELSITQPDA